MLQHMRKHAKYFYVLFVLVIISFIFWGVGDVDNQSPESTAVAQIGDETVTRAEYARAYDQMQRAFREATKGQLTPEMEKSLKLGETVLNSLVAERVLALAAQELNLSVTDKELQEEITTDPTFMRDGIFRKDIYQRALQLQRMTPEHYERMLRRQLLAQKMQLLIASTVEVGQTDLQALPADQAQAEEAARNILAQKQNAAVFSYVEGLKQRMKVKINRDLIS